MVHDEDDDDTGGDIVSPKKDSLWQSILLNLVDHNQRIERMAPSEERREERKEKRSHQQKQL